MNLKEANKKFKKLCSSMKIKSKKKGMEMAKEIGKLIAANNVYYLSLLAAALFATYQQWLVRDREPAACFKAFLNNNWFGLVVFLGIFLNFGID